MEKQFDSGESLRKIAELEKEEQKLNQQLEGKFNKVFEKENQEGREPEIEVNIFYSGHWEEKELKGLAEKFAEADIYIPEGYGWMPEMLEGFRNCSEGGKTPAEIMKEWQITPENNLSYPFILKELEMIHDSGKAVTFIDLPCSSGLERSSRQLPFIYNNDVNFENNLNNFKEFLNNFAGMNKKREEYMLSQFKPKIQELLEQNPILRNKEKLNVLLTLGAAHTGIWHNLKKAGEKVSVDFSSWPVIFSFNNEVVRKYMFSLEIDDELASRAMLEWEIMKYNILPPLGSSLRTQKVMRKIFFRFNQEEIRELLTQPYYLLETFYSKLAEKNLKIPESGEEAEEFLKQ